MKHLHAPWRMQYILEAQSKKQPKGCLFCLAWKSPELKKNLVLYKGRQVLVMMNKYPYNSGHLMVIPRRHIKDLSKLTALEHRELGETLAVCTKALKKVYRPQGFNIGMNLERVAGAGITDHLHYHVVPRWNGDTNFMPVFSDTRVLVESLDRAYDRLKREFDSLSI